jgi:hypothetical protein
MRIRTHKRGFYAGSNWSPEQILLSYCLRNYEEIGYCLRRNGSAARLEYDWLVYLEEAIGVSLRKQQVERAEGTGSPPVNGAGRGGGRDSAWLPCRLRPGGEGRRGGAGEWGAGRVLASLWCVCRSASLRQRDGPLSSARCSWAGLCHVT